MNKFYSYDEPETEDLGIRKQPRLGVAVLVIGALLSLGLMLFAMHEAKSAPVTLDTKAYRLNAGNANKVSLLEIGTVPAGLACTATSVTIGATIANIITDRNKAVLPAGTSKPLQVWARCGEPPVTPPPPPPPAETYTSCGDERGTCAGTGFKRVCYTSTADLCTDAIASNDRKIETTIPVACNNDRFSGDPMPGVVKRCYVSSVVLTPPAPEPNAGVASLSWTAPRVNTDGSPLTELAGYRIYYGTSPEQFTRSIEIPSASTLSYVVGDLAKGTWYFAVRAHTTRGAESANSNIASKVIE